MASFTASIEIIGINPYVEVPDEVLHVLFKQSKKSKGPIAVKGKLNGKPYIQHVVKYKGLWRLYLNTPMRQAAGIEVGDVAKVKIEFDNRVRETPMHPELAKALAANKKVKEVFDAQAPYRQKEMMRYLNSMKTAESVKRNIVKIMNSLKDQISAI